MGSPSTGATGRQENRRVKTMYFSIVFSWFEILFRRIPGDTLP
jgi:hypothetical protein